MLPVLALPALLLAVACTSSAANDSGPTTTPITPEANLPIETDAKLSDPARLARPTSTPTPRPPSQGVHTPEDLLARLAALPDARRLVIDEEVQVEFRPAWYEPVMGFYADAAAIYHIPTLSHISLDREGEVMNRRVYTDQAERRLEAALADETVMDEVRLRLLARTYHPDWPVFQYQQAGGLIAPNRAVEMVPELTVWGDGRVVFVGPDGAIREGRIEPDAVLQILAEAMVLHDLEDHYVAIGATGRPMTFFTVYTIRGRRTVSVYEMDPERASPDEEHHETLERLRAIYRTATQALPDGAAVMDPDEVVVRASPAVDAMTVGEWPSELVGHLRGDDARLAARLGGVGPAEVFQLGGEPHRVTVMPVLPLLHLPSNEWPESGLPRFHSTIAYSAPGTPHRYDQTWPSDAALFYRSAMPGRGWRLVAEDKDVRQVWVRRNVSNDPIVVLRFKEEHMEIELLPVDDGIPSHPGGSLGTCVGMGCELVEGAVPREVVAWFRENLGYLGWAEVSLNVYEYDGWRLRMLFDATEDGVAVRGQRSAIQPAGSPPTTAPTSVR